MELIKWANGKGQKIILTLEEAKELHDLLNALISTRSFTAESERFEVELEEV